MSYGRSDYYSNETADTSRARSRSIWHDCPLLTPSHIDKGVGFFDDFLQGALTPTITTIISDNTGQYNLFGSAGATITYDDAQGGGIILTEATDNEAVNMHSLQHSFQISSLLGKLWFEARIKTSTITTNEQAWVVGLAGAHTQSATVPLTATGAIADLNFVGFHHPEANTAAFDASYKANGVTAVEVNSDIGALVAATYVKLGFRFDPNDNGQARLSFFINGVRQTTKKVIPDNTGTDFPADVRMAPVLAMLLANSAAETITMDWWGCYQEIA